MKQVCQLDASGYFTGMTTADASPLESGVYLIPGGCIEAAAPVIPEGQRAKWNGAWVFEEIPQPEVEPEPTPLTPEEEVEANRRAAYVAEADPLFFKAQRGEATTQEWQDKVAEIKLRYPKEQA
jgi:hypothetical protein